MIRRRTTLLEALEEIEAGDLDGVTAIVVSRAWWDEQSRHDQREYQRRCERKRVQLRADSALSRHFVELASDPAEPPLSTEQRV